MFTLNRQRITFHNIKKLSNIKCRQEKKNHIFKGLHGAFSIEGHIHQIAVLHTKDDEIVFQNI